MHTDEHRPILAQPYDAMAWSPASSCCKVSRAQAITRSPVSLRRSVEPSAQRAMYAKL
jgi:hypothetical protein